VNQSADAPSHDENDTSRHVLQAHELMVVLRCTQKLLVRLKQVGELPAAESSTRLGDWHGNILRIGRRQHLLFISEPVPASGRPSDAR